jgi:hypothetical protein
MADCISEGGNKDAALKKARENMEGCLEARAGGVKFALAPAVLNSVRKARRIASYLISQLF